jgi:hypothetical protein
LEAVLSDLRETAPDLILHGSDLGWPGVPENPGALVSL